MTRITLSPLIRESDEKSLGRLSSKLDEIRLVDNQGTAQINAGQDAREEAQKSASVSAASLGNDAEAVARLARAQLLSGNPDTAIDSFERALKLDPNNARNYFEYSMALLRAGKPRSAIIPHLRKAAQLSVSAGDLDLREQIFNSLTYSYLYEPAPNGFENAIQTACEYLDIPDSKASGSVLVNLACGYGQQAKWIQARKPDDHAAFSNARRNALKAIRDASAIDIKWKARLRELLYDGGGDNDLEVFIDDQEFKDAVAA